MCRWITQQENNLKTAKVAVLYASAYGNTAALAQTISRGITKAGVGVEMVNLEQVKTVEVEDAVRSSQGFCIGALLLGFSVQTMLLEKWTRRSAELCSSWRFLYVCRHMHGIPSLGGLMALQVECRIKA
jgi:hypothetical protein